MCYNRRVPGVVNDGLLDWCSYRPVYSVKYPISSEKKGSKRGWIVSLLLIHKRTYGLCVHCSPVVLTLSLTLSPPSGMRILVTLLLDTLPMLGNVLLLCFFVFFIFGIVGVQLWVGRLRNRCFVEDNLPLWVPCLPCQCVICVFVQVCEDFDLVRCQYSSVNAQFNLSCGTIMCW